MSNVETDLSTEMQSILAELSNDFANAEVFNQWQPDDGNYTVLLCGYKDGVSTKGTTKTAWWKVDNRIIDPAHPDIDNKEFSVFFRSSAIGFLKGAVSCIAGRKVDDIRQAANILAEAATKGYVCTIRVSTTEKGFKNYTYLDVVQRTA